MNTSPGQSPLVAELLKSGRLTPDIVSRIPNTVSPADIEQYLVSQNLATDDDILQAYASLYHLPFVHLRDLAIEPSVLALIPELVARRYDVVAYKKEGDIVHVALAAPKRMVHTNNVGLLKRLQQELKLRIAPAFAPLTEIRQAHGGYTNVAPVPPTANSQSVAPSVPSATSALQVVPKEISFESLTIVPDVLATFPYEVALRYHVVPFARPKEGQLSVAAQNPEDPTVRELLDFVQSRNGLTITVYPVNEANFRLAIAQYPESKKKTVPVSQGDLATPDLPSAAAESVTAPSSEAEVSDLATASATPPAEPSGVIIPEVSSDDIASISKEPKIFDTQQYQGTATDRLVAATQDTENILESYFAREPQDVQELVGIVQSGNVPRVVAATIALAINTRASDIHIEASKDKVRLRFRIDGELTDIIYLPRVMLAPIVSRVKILSQMKIDENRIPQDGRFDVTFHGREVDIRVSTLPTVHGEKVVMRILDKTAGVMSLKDMGLDGANLERLEASVKKAYGMVLSTGPTGSGKTTTLYAIMQEISQPEVNIVTIEDPVEYEITGINQTQIKPKIGFTFAEGLRSILRQDPNVIMVGEIRDKETADMATHAALTGHLVLSTLHTNNASGAMPRLVDMGIEPFLITSSVSAVVGQRLVRRVCPDCKAEVQLPESVLDELATVLASANISAELKDRSRWHFVAGKGCSKCHNGYRGRIGIFEILTMSPTIEALVVKGEPASAIEAAAVKEGMITLKQDGLLKAIAGLTTIEEIMKATAE